MAILLTGCVNVDEQTPRSQSSVIDSILFADLTAKRTRPESRAGDGAGENFSDSEGVMFLSTGRGQPPREPNTGGVGGSAGAGYQLNFDNADIQSVVKTILGDTLGLTYTIDSRIEGEVTLSSPRPVDRKDLIPILESLLRMYGGSLVQNGSLYRVIPESEAPGVGRTDPPGARISPGSGVTVLPLRYVSAETMVRLIEGFAVRPGKVRVQSSANYILIEGSSPERESAARTALSFDVDWMRDQSVGIFPLRHVAPDVMITELERIFESRDGGLGAQLVQFQPMPRLRAVMVVSKRANLVKRARTWIRRLDRESAEVGQNVYVYRAKYRSAEEIAKIMTGIFGEGSGSTGETAAAQVAPAATPIRSRVDDDEEEEEDSVVSDGRQQAQTTTAAAVTTTGGQGIKISADKTNNSVVFYCDKKTYRRILRALRKIDRPPLQVAVNVMIAEIQLNDNLRYGVQYFLKGGEHGLGNSSGSVGLWQEVTKNIKKQLPGFNFLIGSETSPDVIISAFDKITDVEILSSPSVVVLENQTATLQVGEEIPVTIAQQQSTESGGAPLLNQIEYRSAGIILKVTPRISENGVVTMSIEQEISTVLGTTPTLTPTIAQRKITSSVSVNSGQTVLLGGLIAESNEGGKAGVPVLHRLPAVGPLFGNTESKGIRNELIVLINPTVVRNAKDAQKVAEDLRSRMVTTTGAHRLNRRP